MTVSVSAIDCLGVRIPRSGLRQTAADEVGPGDNGHIEPCLAGDELIGAVGVPALDHGGADENRYDDPTNSGNGGVGDDQLTQTIDFGTDGVKRLLLRYAPVEKLEET